MSEAWAPAGLRACLTIVAELRAAAMDASSDLLLGERRALATLATAVEARAGQRAGAKVDGASAEAAVTEALMALDDVLRKSGAGSGEDA